MVLNHSFNKSRCHLDSSLLVSYPWSHRFIGPSPLGVLKCIFRRTSDTGFPPVLKPSSLIPGLEGPGHASSLILTLITRVTEVVLPLGHLCDLPIPSFPSSPSLSGLRPNDTFYPTTTDVLSLLSFPNLYTFSNPILVHEGTHPYMVDA